jgi:hypothetical protein
VCCRAAADDGHRRGQLLKGHGAEARKLRQSAGQSASAGGSSRPVPAMGACSLVVECSNRPE